MNREDIVAKMSLREKEIFEKYKDTYPFPIREFIEEIGIKVIIESGKMFAGLSKNEEDGVHHIVVTGSPDKETENVMLCLILMHFYFERYTNNIDMEWGTRIASLFLMPTETFLKIGAELSAKSKFSYKKMGKYFGVPPGLISLHADYLMGITNLAKELEMLFEE